MDLLASDLALSVFVPTESTGIKLEPYRLEIKTNIPAFLKARARLIREAPFRDAKAELASHANQPAGSIRMAAMGGVGLCFDFQGLCGHTQELQVFTPIDE